ncbi:MAG TPA: hypothetical protein VIA62_10555, partial [Thermoanaerobaculia bacterium]|nr:hypothetical protein [Thermoanaerobaculia bacterium]
FSRSYARLLRPGFACLTSKTLSESGPPLRRAFDTLEEEIAKYCERENLPLELDSKTQQITNQGL